MIFLTVGSDTPFDRLVRAVDRWAFENGRPDVYAQIGRESWKPQYVGYTEMLRPHDFRRHMMSAKVVVAHAGMGTILSALQLQKPMLVMPRRVALGETRNDHQYDTAAKLRGIDGIDVAFDESDLLCKLKTIDRVKGVESISDHADESLTAQIREFIHRQEMS